MTLNFADFKSENLRLLVLRNEKQWDSSVDAPVFGVAADFADARKELAEHEGGNDDDPQDPGGRTSRGIIQSEYDRYRTRKGKPQRDVWRADDVEVDEIYRTEYWAAMRGDDLPAGVDYAVFDYGVNSGISRSARVLQQLIGANVTKRVDDDTVRLAQTIDAAKLINDISDQRLAFLKGLSTWSRFGHGWATRVADVRTASLKMASAPKSKVKPASKGWLSMLLDAGLTWLRARSAPAKPLDLAGRLDAAMKKRGYKLFTAPGECNIIYVEGMDPDGTKNDNKPNVFNDTRFVLGFDGGNPKILGAWEGTVNPGKYWVENRMNPKGAANIKFGQYTAWQIGQHHSHEAWVQTGGPVTVFRDDNEDFSRDGDKEDTGEFGINLHGGYDLPKNDLGRSSAGCLVGRSMAGHREFMSITKADPRVKANSRFVMTATILPSSDV